MKTAFIILALTVAGALADGFGSHRHNANHRQGRRLSSRRPGRQGRNRAFRRGRTEDLEAAPPTYAAAADPAYAPPVEETTAAFLEYDYPVEEVPTYEAAAPIDAYGASDDPADPNLAMLEKAVPGIPGEDYPINAEVPETAFSCDGQVDGGYYADPEAQCQVFHICTADGQGGLAKYSFLCPNGTIFNQNYFICDWWFNFDCSEAEGLYSLNDDIAAERAALSGEEEPTDAYGAATVPADYPEYEYPEEVPTYEEEEVVPTYEAETEAPLAIYETADTAVLPTAIPTYEEAEREARRGRAGRRGRNGRRNGRRNNSRGRSGRRQGGRRQQGRRQGRRNNFRG